MINIDFKDIQKESFFKSFILFFIIIELFLFFIFYHYAKIEKEHLKKSLFLQMKNYSFFFDNDKFDMDIVRASKTKKLYELYMDNKYLYILVDIKDEPNNLLKIIYPRTKFNKEVNSIYKTVEKNFILLSIISLFISILFSIYSLYPLLKSYIILKEFMKDIIHDINTPISAMKLNISMIEKQTEEVQSILNSINTLEMIHKNLDNYLNDSKLDFEPVSIKRLLYEQISFFVNLYDWLDWQIYIKDEVIQTDKYLLGRVVYNLLNNACKYNINKGYIKINYHNGILTIANSSYGIKHIEKVFDRFYKESDRGLGIGLHITSKILKQLKYKYRIKQTKNKDVIISIYIS